MSDTPLFRPGDDVAELEALLREIEPDDVELVEPPADLWAGIDAAIVAHEPAPVVPLDDRRSAFSSRFLAAAAAVAVIAAGVAIVNGVRSTGPDVVATATLVHDPLTFDPLGADASATASLIERADGYEIRLDDAALPDPDTNDLELWLISTDDVGEITDVQPVSLVDATEPGTYAVPAGLDPDVYTVVDISIEPRDGDETHSGRSILRGTLDA